MARQPVLRLPVSLLDQVEVRLDDVGYRASVDGHRVVVRGAPYGEVSARVDGDWLDVPVGAAVPDYLAGEGVPDEERDVLLVAGLVVSALAGHPRIHGGGGRATFVWGDHVALAHRGDAAPSMRYSRVREPIADHVRALRGRIVVRTASGETSPEAGASPERVHGRLNPSGRPGFQSWLSVEGVELRVGVYTHRYFIEGEGGRRLAIDDPVMVAAHRAAVEALRGGREPEATLVLEDVFVALGDSFEEAARKAKAIRGPMRRGTRLVSHEPEEGPPGHFAEGLGRPRELVPEPPPSSKEPIPFEVDPDVVDRGRRAHVVTENVLHRAIDQAGMSPRIPEDDEPNYDVAWDDGDAITVAEVKSLTAANEVKQLRLGLGQLLDYQSQLGAKGREVRAVLAVERKPVDPRWIRLCRRHGVTLAWPETFPDLF